MISDLQLVSDKVSALLSATLLSHHILSPLLTLIPSAAFSIKEERHIRVQQLVVRANVASQGCVQEG